MLWQEATMIAIGSIKKFYHYQEWPDKDEEKIWKWYLVEVYEQVSEYKYYCKSPTTGRLFEALDIYLHDLDANDLFHLDELTGWRNL
jgi:quinol monooxygenase YgiN